MLTIIQDKGKLESNWFQLEIFEANKIILNYNMYMC